mmetsp:Transcript_16891/g.23900  ORF Transcript_16891/g.23900 Transcript_16891/m.23900 type:complete len:767 (+) Transcript_16891:34-2334(+)
MSKEFNWKTHMANNANAYTIWRNKDTPEYEAALQVADNAEETRHQSTVSHEKTNSSFGDRKILNTLCSRCCPANRLLYVIVFVFFLFIVIASISLKKDIPKKSKSTTLLTESPTSSPFFSPRPQSKRDHDIREILQSISGRKILTKGTPQSKAFFWIVEDDRLRLQSKSPYLIQRYVLAVFYFEMNEMGKEHWLDEVLGECSWSGISCNEDARVSKIELEGSGLRGEIPSEIWALSSLSILDLSSNFLSGSIPVELGFMKDLEILKLDGNLLVGEVPARICSRREYGTLAIFTTDCGNDVEKEIFCGCCTNCQADGLGYSPPLASSESDTFLSHDKEQIEINDVSLTDNSTGNGVYNYDELHILSSERAHNINAKCLQISGDIVSISGSPENRAMEWIILKDGLKISVDDTNFVQRYVVMLSYFAMGGDSWKYSNWLQLSKNECQLVGIICNNLGFITHLNFHATGLRGKIPKEISNLSSLVEIDFSQNMLSGAIPSEFGYLLSLEKLVLRKNDLVGSVDQALCDLRANGKLFEFSVDCTKISCLCCTNCASQNNSNKTFTSDTSTGEIYNLNGIRDAQITKRLQQYTNLQGNDRIKALDWVINKDQRKLSAEDPHLLQRYVMVLLYFATSGENWSHSSWLSGTASSCDWNGVLCNSRGHVVGISLASNNLVGTIPQEVAQLSFLKALDLSRNEIIGAIPKQLGKLSTLNVIILHSNNMVEPIPNEICMLEEMGSLIELWVDCESDERSESKVACPHNCCTKCGPG